jgi:hypothetical protein
MTRKETVQKKGAALRQAPAPFEVHPKRSVEWHTGAKPTQAPPRIRNARFGARSAQGGGRLAQLAGQTRGAGAGRSGAGAPAPSAAPRQVKTWLCTACQKARGRGAARLGRPGRGRGTAYAALVRSQN